MSLPFVYSFTMGMIIYGQYINNEELSKYSLALLISLLILLLALSYIQFRRDVNYRYRDNISGFAEIIIYVIALFIVSYIFRVIFLEIVSAIGLFILGIYYNYMYWEIKKL